MFFFSFLLKRRHILLKLPLNLHNLHLSMEVHSPEHEFDATCATVFHWMRDFGRRQSANTAPMCIDGKWTFLLPSPPHSAGSVSCTRFQKAVQSAYPIQYDDRITKGRFNGQWHFYLQEVLSLQIFHYDADDYTAYPTLSINTHASELRCCVGNNHLEELDWKEETRWCDVVVGTALANTYLQASRLLRFLWVFTPSLTICDECRESILHIMENESTPSDICIKDPLLKHENVVYCTMLPSPPEIPLQIFDSTNSSFCHLGSSVSLLRKLCQEVSKNLSFWGTHNAGKIDTIWNIRSRGYYTQMSRTQMRNALSRMVLSLVSQCSSKCRGISREIPIFIPRQLELETPIFTPQQPSLKTTKEAEYRFNPYANVLGEHAGPPVLWASHSCAFSHNTEEKKNHIAHLPCTQSVANNPTAYIPSTVIQKQASNLQLG